MISKPLLAVALAFGAALLAGCTVEQAYPPPIPATTVEVIPKPPVSGTQLIWQPGHWDWNGTNYVWTPGVYVPRTTQSNEFMPGWWKLTPSGWQWQPAHWL